MGRPHGPTEVSFEPAAPSATGDVPRDDGCTQLAARHPTIAVQTLERSLKYTLRDRDDTGLIVRDELTVGTENVPAVLSVSVEHCSGSLEILG